MNSCATCRLNSMLWERCLAMLSSFESPAHPVKSLTSNCPAPGAHSSMWPICHPLRRDFADEGLELRRPMFAEFTPQLADRYIERFSGGFDGVDFSRYSKVKNPGLKRYNFGFAQLLQ